MSSDEPDNQAVSYRRPYHIRYFDRNSEFNTARHGDPGICAEVPHLVFNLPQQLA
jgi:hypothetical protein